MLRVDDCRENQFHAGITQSRSEAGRSSGKGCVCAGRGGVVRQAEKLGAVSGSVRQSRRRESRDIMPRLNSHDTIFGVKWTQKRKLVVLMTFHMLWGLFLWFSISKYGLGISTDSVHLLFASLKFIAGQWAVFIRRQFRFVMAAALSHAFSVDPTRHAIGSICFGHHSASHLSFIGISLCLSILFLKIFPENFLPCLGGQYSFGYWRGCSDHPLMASARIICISSSSFFLFCWPAIT